MSRTACGYARYRTSTLTTKKKVHGTAIIEQVSFYGDQHLQFLGAVVITIQYDAIGASASWPPATMNITQPGVQ